MLSLFLPLVILAVVCLVIGLILRSRAEERRSLVAFALAGILIVGAIASLSVGMLQPESDAATVRISIDYYRGDGSADSGTSGDPYFEIWVAYLAENQSFIDETFVSSIFNNTEEIEHPFSTEVAIPDGVLSLAFAIRVYDWNPEGNTQIDCCSDDENHVFHFLVRPFDSSWTSDGSLDGNDEIDCELGYSISEID